MNITEQVSVEPRVYVVVAEDGRIIALPEDQLFVEPDGTLTFSDPPVTVILLSENEVDDV